MRVKVCDIPTSESSGGSGNKTFLVSCLLPQRKSKHGVITTEISDLKLGRSSVDGNRLPWELPCSLNSKLLYSHFSPPLPVPHLGDFKSKSRSRKLDYPISILGQGTPNLSESTSERSMDPNRSGHHLIARFHEFQGEKIVSTGIYT